MTRASMAAISRSQPSTPRIGTGLSSHGRTHSSHASGLFRAHDIPNHVISVRSSSHPELRDLLDSYNSFGPATMTTVWRTSSRDASEDDDSNEDMEDAILSFRSRPPSKPKSVPIGGGGGGKSRTTQEVVREMAEENTLEDFRELAASDAD